MPEASFAIEVVSGVPVVGTPEEIDITNAASLRMALLGASGLACGAVVVDMSGTHFCDSSGMHVLIRAHNQTCADGGELLLVLRADTLLRVFAITGVDQVIPSFPSLEEALAHAGARASSGVTAVGGLT